MRFLVCGVVALLMAVLTFWVITYQDLQALESEFNTFSEQQMAVPVLPEEPGEITKETVISEPTNNCRLFDDFSEENNQWFIVNDGVMGGLSKGNLSYQNQALVFSGFINTNGGGFSSFRGALPEGILSDYNSVRLTVRGDSRAYEVTFRDAQNFRITHRDGFKASSNTEWSEVDISFEELETAFFGRSVIADAFDKNLAYEMGIILSDGLDGDFNLEIDSIEFCL